MDMKIKQVNGSTMNPSAVDASIPRADYIDQKITLEDARPQQSAGSTKPNNPADAGCNPSISAAVPPRGALAYLRRHEQLEKSPSTDMMAAKNSNELKKKYLLNYSGPMGSLTQKSASAANLDSKFRSFVDTISEAQKLLNPAPQPSVPMQVNIFNYLY